jgi:uncharacterized protein (TIGR02453 family)
MISENALALLAELKANNNKAWFDAHREEIKRDLQAPFGGVLEKVSKGLAKSAFPLRGGPQTMFRMNRDTRFSHDKSPYNSHLSGLLTPTGDKNGGPGILCLHLDDAGGFMTAGAYNLDPKALAPIRDAIVADPERFKTALKQLHNAGLDLNREMSLRSMPQGYSEYADAWFANDLKLKSLTAREALSPNDWVSGGVVERAVRFATACAGLNQFVANAALKGGKHANGA